MFCTFIAFNSGYLLMSSINIVSRHHRLFNLNTIQVLISANRYYTGLRWIVVRLCDISE